MQITAKATINKAFTASDLGRSRNCSLTGSLTGSQTCILSAALCSALLNGSVLLTGIALAPVGAREQWQMQHPEGPPPTGPVGKGWVPDAPSAPGSVPGLVGSGQSSYGQSNYGQSSNAQSSTGMAPGLVAPGLPNAGMGSPAGSDAGVPAYGGKRQIPDEIIQQMLVSRIGAGSMLTGVLGDDISSKNSHAGDLFSVVLRDGHSQNGHELIPRGARIIGKVVMAAPAAGQRTAMPGNVEIGLTTLVFPDGRSIAFTGFIERNPAHTSKKPPVSRGPGMSMSDYTSSVGSMFGSFTSGIGAVRARTNRGKDLLLHEGEVVPVRVTRTIDLTKMSPPTAPPSQPLSNPFDASAQSQNFNGNNLPPNLSGAGAGMPPQNMYPAPSNSQIPILPKELPDPF